MILTLRLHAGESPAKREQTVKRQIDVKNYSNLYQVNLEGQGIHNKKNSRSRTFNKNLRLEDVLETLDVETINSF